ncbi:MAG: tautomerase family protein [Pseudomonadota bacterium]
MSGTIRKGRTDEQKRTIAELICGALIEHGGVEDHRVGVMIRETPASWVLEGGEIMPEPEEEAAWFAAHEAKRGSEA